METIWDNFNAIAAKAEGVWGIILTIFIKAVQIAFFICFAIIFLPAYLVVTYTHKLWAKMLTDLLKL